MRGLEDDLVLVLATDDEFAGRPRLLVARDFRGDAHRGGEDPGGAVIDRCRERCTLEQVFAVPAPDRQGAVFGLAHLDWRPGRGRGVRESQGRSPPRLIGLGESVDLRRDRLAIRRKLRPHGVCPGLQSVEIELGGAASAFELGDLHRGDGRVPILRNDLDPRRRIERRLARVAHLHDDFADALAWNGRESERDRFAFGEGRGLVVEDTAGGLVARGERERVGSSFKGALECRASASAGLDRHVLPFHEQDLSRRRGDPLDFDDDVLGKAGAFEHDREIRLPADDAVIAWRDAHHGTRSREREMPVFGRVRVPAQRRPRRQVLRLHAIARDVETPGLPVGGAVDLDVRKRNAQLHHPYPVSDRRFVIPAAVPREIVLDAFLVLSVEDRSDRIPNEHEPVARGDGEVDLDGIVLPDVVVAYGAVRRKLNARQGR